MVHVPQYDDLFITLDGKVLTPVGSYEGNHLLELLCRWILRGRYSQADVLGCEVSFGSECCSCDYDALRVDDGSYDEGVFNQERLVRLRWSSLAGSRHIRRCVRYHGVWFRGRLVVIDCESGSLDCYIEDCELLELS